jgi:hypothetical protein
MNQIGVVFSIVVFCTVGFCKADQDCDKLSSELLSMKNAQTQLLSSMVNKDLALARSLDLQAENVQKNRVYSEQLVSSLKRSANNLRDHHKSEAKIIDRYERLTAQLLTKVIGCLSNPTKVGKNAGSRNYATGLE